MNAAYVKLALAVLWLVPGFGLLANDFANGQVFGFTLLGYKVAFAWVFLAFGGLNLARWFLARSSRNARAERYAFRNRTRRPAEPSEPDANFDFTDRMPPGR